MPKKRSSYLGSAVSAARTTGYNRPTATPSGGTKRDGSSNNLVAPNTGIGQHFLKNPAVVSAIIAKASIKPTDVVLEIGPGTGNMTLPMLQQAKKVVALEMDNRMIREVLKRTEQTENNHKLSIIQGDAIKTAWPFFDVMVANLPYQISSPTVFKLLNHRPMFRCAVLMFQEEFALRLTARPGEALYCRLSVNVQLLAKVDQLMRVKKENFRPPPKVESRVVRIELKNPPPAVNFTEWDGMIRLLFNRKNKTLRSVLNSKPVLKMLEENRRTVKAMEAGIGRNDNDNINSNSNNRMEMEDDNEERPIKEIIEDILSKEPWVGMRASKMSLDDFLLLLTQFNGRGIHFC